MMHPDGFGAARPIRVPIILGVGGPKGEAVARELADGVFATQATAGFDRSSVLCFGTVLDDGEDPGSDRAMAAAGHAAALAYHAAYLGGVVTSLPDGDRWLAALEEVPERERHLALHEGHLIDANARDRAVITGDTLAMLGSARSAAGWRERISRTRKRERRRSRINPPVRTSPANSDGSWRPPRLERRRGAGQGRSSRREHDGRAEGARAVDVVIKRVGQRMSSTGDGRTTLSPSRTNSAFAGPAVTASRPAVMPIVTTMRLIEWDLIGVLLGDRLGAGDDRRPVG